MPVRDFSTCPRCGAPTRQSVSYSGAPSEFWRNCTHCRTYINTYIPQSHQEAFHKDPHLYRGNFGGFGTGKTLTSREEFYKHLFLTPNGNTLIGAAVNSQYEQTIKRDIEQDLPADFVKTESVQKQYVDYINGHRLMYRPLYEEGILRSLNLSMFVIVEASEVKPELFTQLKTRLRNKTAGIQDTNPDGTPKFTFTDRGVPVPVMKSDWRTGIVESNPDSGYIRTQVLMVSDDIQKHGNVTDMYAVFEEERDPDTSSHVAATDVNQFLPPNFYKENAKNKPIWWIRRYLEGSFSYAEGLVYPSAMHNVIPDFEIPRRWKRIIAFDYGLSDDSVFLFGAIDEVKGVLYIYKESRTNNKNIEGLANLYFEGIQDVPSGGIWSQLIDPKSGPKRDYDKKSLSDHFLDYGIAFKSGAISVDARIFRLNTYLESGKLKIFESCVGLIKELREYKYPAKKIGVASSDKPVDKNNHAINPLEWIAMDLPADPAKLLYGVYNRQGRDISNPEHDAPSYTVHALSDDYNSFGGNDDGEGIFGMLDYAYM